MSHDAHHHFIESEENEQSFTVHQQAAVPTESIGPTAAAAPLPYPNNPTSIRDRIAHHCRSEGLDFNRLLVRYGHEGLLRRIEQVDQEGVMVLKGGYLMNGWVGTERRHTMDIDLSSSRTMEPDQVASFFRQVAAAPEADGLTLDPDSVKVLPITGQTAEAGHRVVVRGKLGTADIRLQADVGQGDVIFPSPVHAALPTVLPDSRSPVLAQYQPETAIAEKVHAMHAHGSANSRVKDIFDVMSLSATRSFDGATLQQSIERTAHHLQTPLNAELAAFESDFLSKTQAGNWAKFSKSADGMDLPSPEGVTEQVRNFLQPVLAASERNEKFEGTWVPGQGWCEAGLFTAHVDRHL